MATLSLTRVGEHINVLNQYIHKNLTMGEEPV